MTDDCIDIHPHIISTDETRYPPAPLLGERLAWSQGGGATAEALLAGMDAAGIARAVVVQSATTYGYDNSYVVDSCARHPDRLAAVGSIDVLANDAVDRLNRWADLGMIGLRLFTTHGAPDSRGDPLTSPFADPVLARCVDLKLPLCVFVGPERLPALRALADRHPGLTILLDHLGRPQLDDGPSYENAAGLFALAAIPNLVLKLTNRNVADLGPDTAKAAAFVLKLVRAFGAERVAWGSNSPMAPGTLADLLTRTRDVLALLTDAERASILAGTARRTYPGLG